MDFFDADIAPVSGEVVGSPPHADRATSPRANAHRIDELPLYEKAAERIRAEPWRDWHKLRG
jgi:hypothetical protein